MICGGCQNNFAFRTKRLMIWAYRCSSTNNLIHVSGTFQFQAYWKLMIHLLSNPWAAGTFAATKTYFVRFFRFVFRNDQRSLWILFVFRTLFLDANLNCQLNGTFHVSPPRHVCCTSIWRIYLHSQQNWNSLSVWVDRFLMNVILVDTSRIMWSCVRESWYCDVCEIPN